jgi:hypothetical protein
MKGRMTGRMDGKDDQHRTDGHHGYYYVGDRWDNSITFTNCGGPCLAFGILKKPLTRWLQLCHLTIFTPTKQKLLNLK